MKIAVIGGGAAGMMAAATILEESYDAEVVLFEKNPALGKKVIISGGGRCNVTTGVQDVRDVLRRYPRGEKFLSSAMRQFSPQDVYAWFEDHGVPLKTEEDLRVFPQSNDGRDIVRVFERIFTSPRIDVRVSRQIDAVSREGQGFSVHLRGGTEEYFDRVILTTGGQAYRHTGSTGDGYAFAIACGHRITPLAASLSAFFTRETWPQALAGVSFERVCISAKTIAGEPSYTGPLLFTHKGVTGPAVFALSGLVAFEPCAKDQPMSVFIDLFPDTSHEELYRHMEACVKDSPKKACVNSLATLLPRSAVEIACELVHINPETRGGDMRKDELMRLVDWCKGIPLHVIGRGAGDEFVTAGGVELAEVNPSTMESKLCPGLFFAGEILNIDGFTGGFNLQASWATGRLAGRHAMLSE